MQPRATLCSTMRMWFFLSITMSTVSCSSVVYQPTPVVPTKYPLPFSVKVKLAQIDSYMVEPGSTMLADPAIENHVTRTSSSLDDAKKQWEKSIADYVAARKTFSYLSMDSQTDLDMTLRLNIYIDPGVLFQFNHVYIAKVDAKVIDSTSQAVLSSYQGFGKSIGEVSRGGAEDDRAPVNQAVQASLDNLLSKVENDSRLRRP